MKIPKYIHTLVQAANNLKNLCQSGIGNLRQDKKESQYSVIPYLRQDKKESQYSVIPNDINHKTPPTSRNHKRCL